MAGRLQAICSIAAIFLMCPLLASARSATLTNNGFQGVIVSISSAIQASDKSAMDNIVNSIENLIRGASLELYNATGRRAFFENVKIMVPSTWTGWSNGRGDDTMVDQVAAIDRTRFEKSDIRLDSPNAAYGDQPYVQQSKGCGEPGDFIHITKDFLFGSSNSFKNSSARLLAREWIKYYFGVYDENGYDYNDQHPPNYFTSSGQIVASVCTNSRVTYKTYSCSALSSVNGLSASCKMEVDPKDGQNTNVSSSLMSLPIVPVAYKVCDATNHNSAAPNKQNLMCDGKSVMEVIMSNSQMKNGLNPPSSLSTPTGTAFEIVQISPLVRMALYMVWDIQDSDKNYYSAGPAISKFIETDVPTGSYFGLTTTENSTFVKVFQKVETESDRQVVIEGIQPTKSTLTGGDVSVAVETAIKQLQTLHEDQYLGSILIITDDADTNKWSRICQSANAKTYEVHLITYTSATVTSYIKAKCEGSQTIINPMVQPPKNSSDDIGKCFKQLQERQQFDRVLRNLPSAVLPSLYSAPIVYKDQMYSDANNGSFTIDDPNSISSNFYVMTCQNLADPYEYDKLIKCTLNNQRCNYHLDKTYTICMDFSLTNTTWWDYQCLEGFTDKKAPFVVTVVGKPNSAAPVNIDKQPIQLDSWIHYEDKPQKSYTTVRIFASLRQGTTPVFGATVVATVNGESNKNFTYVTLRDDGSGNPDVTLNDGVYSAYFTQFGSSSGYTVNVRATDNSRTAKVPTKQYSWLTHTNDMGLTQTESFSRQDPTGSFVAKTSLDSDIVEPGRILDLRVQSTAGEMVTLAWTAPGDDLDFGIAQKYVIKCSPDKSQLSEAKFTERDQDPSIPQITPAAAATIQMVTINGMIDDQVHYCAIKTFDDRQLSSVPSNVVAYYLVQDGLTTAAKAGISVGVILGIIAIVVIFLLCWFCYCKKHKQNQPAKPTNGSEGRPASQALDQTKYTPVPMVDMQANKQRVSYVLKTENEKNQTQIPLATINKSGSKSSVNSEHSNDNTSTIPVRDSRTPSPKAMPIDHRDGVGYNPYSGQQHSRPPFTYQNVPADDDDDDDVIAGSADIAVPQVLTKVATIENTKGYTDSPKVPPKPKQYEAPYNKILTGATYNPAFASGPSRNAQV